MAAATDEVVVELSPAGAPGIVEVELSDAELDVDDSARLSPSEPPEQAVADNARMSNRTRRFTDAHHRTVS